mgnify:CR=1 FL=1
MDSPSQQQRRIAHVDPSTSDTQAFRHGSSSEGRKGQESPPDLTLEKERLTTSAASMERRGVVGPHGGQAPVSVTSPQSNVRSDGSNPDVSQQHEEFKQLPDDDLRVLLCRAQVSQWADHIVALGAVCVQDVAMTSAKSLAPMPILAAERLIRFAAQHSKEEAPSEDLKRAEREMRDADRMAEREVRSGNVTNDAEHDEDEEDELERARLAMEDEAENEGRGRSSYLSQHPFGRALQSPSPATNVSNC